MISFIKPIILNVHKLVLINDAQYRSMALDYGKTLSIGAADYNQHSDNTESSNTTLNDVECTRSNAIRGTALISVALLSQK